MNNDPIYETFPKPAPTDKVAGTLLVGAEGMSEIRGVDWARQPTQTEVEAFIRQWSEASEKQGRTFNYSDYTVDGIGRPYWLLTVLDHAPESAREKASRYARVLRLTY